jgi:hypothetical protein
MLGKHGGNSGQVPGVCRLTIRSSRNRFVPAKIMARKACHVFASTTRFGLTQALGPSMSIALSSLSPLKLLRAPVWEFESDGSEELSVFPVSPLPVSSLDGRFVASHLYLANGQVAIGLLSNLALQHPELNEHFITLSVFGSNSAIFHLARYHDPGWEQRGPSALAQFLGLSIGDIFPIRYDVADVVSGPESVIRGTIQRKPSFHLSRAELIAYAVP